MRAPPVHCLTLDAEETFSYRAGSYLALLDVGTYFTFVGEKADGLDIRAHLQRQTRALTVLAWDVRRPMSRVRLAVIPANEPLERLMPSGRQPFAQGWLRTFGQLALVGDEWLEACARDRGLDLSRGEKAGARPHRVEVPPGTYAVLIYGGEEGDGDGEVDSARPSDVVILRHHPFPPPRVAPVRLGGLVVPESGDASA